MNLKAFISLNIAIYIFFSFNPYFKWIIPNYIIHLYFLFTFITLAALSSSLVFNKNKSIIALCLLSFMVYFASPLVHDLRIGHLISPIPFLLILFFKDDIIGNGYKLLKKIMVIVCLFSLFIWFLNLINIPLPYITYDPEFRINPNNYYRIYGPTISLYSGDSPLGSVHNIERITGVFAEPGHFGIYLGLMLAAEKFRLSDKYNRIYIFTGLLTFSTVFYGILLIGIIYRIIEEKRFSKNTVYAFIFIFILVLSFFIGGEPIRELTYGRVIDRIDDENQGIITNLIDSRVDESFIIGFERFITTPQSYIGYGYFWDEETYATTNWRGIIFRFGIIGMALILILLFSISRNTNNLHTILLFSISLLILSHRSYLLYTPAIYVVIYISTVINNQYTFTKSENNQNITEQISKKYKK